MKKLDDLGLFDDFSIRGRWFLPQDPTDVVPGELTFSTSGIELKLDGAFKTLAGPTAYEQLLRSDVPKTPVIFGSTVAGEHVTLRQAFASTVGSECVFVANELIVGAHVDEAADGNVQFALTELTHLDEWAYAPQFRMEDQSEKERTRFSFPTDPLEILCVEDAQPFRKLTISAGVQQQLHRTELQFKIRTSLRVEFASPQSIMSARTALDRLTGLFSLLVGESVYPKKIRLMVQTDSRPQSIEVFISLRRRRVRIEHAHQMTFPLSQILADAPALIRQWLAQEEKLRPVYNLLLSTVQAPDQYVQSTFLSLTQALESFHRIAYGGEYESKDVTSPSFCTTVNERVYITASDCEIGFGGTQGLQAAGAGGL